MAIDTSYFSADLAAMIADLPATATSACLVGSVAVSVAELSAEQMLILTGNQDRRSFACTVPIAAFSAEPKAQMRVAITRPGEPSPTNYQIFKVQAGADGVAYTLVLIQDVRNP